MSELGTSIMYKGRKYLEGSIDGSKFATGMEGSISDTATKILTLQLKNEETDLGEAVTITLPYEAIDSTDYATDITLTLNASTGILSIQLFNENNEAIGTAITVDNTPTQNSTNPITSGGVYTAVNNIETIIGDINTALEGML